MTWGFRFEVRVPDAVPVVVLVPRQLRITGMTGNVPYYGGRFTPAQAYAAAHPAAPPPPPPLPSVPAGSSGPRRDPLAALEQLRESGVLDQQEYEKLRARVAP